jgi:hypothetical protein
MAFFIAFFHCCFFGGFSIISSGDGRLYFWSVFLILQMNSLSSSLGRRTIYALLGPGLHARSGMSPVVLLKIWNTYAVPRYLYGLEIQAYTPLDTKKLEQLQRATCRQFQCLPERTAAVAIYTLIGAEPIETTLDKNAMILFTTLARLDSSIEKDILIWEMENSKEEDRLFICRIRKTLHCVIIPLVE